MRSTPTPRARRAPSARGVSFGLAERVFVGTAAIVAVVLAAAMYVTTHAVRRAADVAARRGLDQAADITAQLLSARERTLSGGARVFVQGPYFRSLVTGQRRDDILDQAFEATEQLGADWVFITDERGRLLAKSDEPSAAGEDMSTVPLIAGALRGHPTSGFGVSRDSLLFQAVAVPVIVPGGAPVGVLVATKVVDSLLAADVRAAASSDVLFYTLDALGRPRAAVTTISRGAASRVADRDAPASVDSLLARLAAHAPPAGRSASAARATDHLTLRVGGDEYLAEGSAATTAGGEPVGGFVVLRRSDVSASAVVGAQQAILIAGSAGALLALLAAGVAARRVSRPVRAMASAARHAALGDYSAALALERPGAAHGDEIAALGGALREMLAEMRDREALAALRAAVPRVKPTPIARLTGRRTPATSRAAGGLAPAAPERIPGGLAGSLADDAVLAGRYEIGEQLGAGGMGVVYRALDRTLGEPVAVKLLRPELLAADPRARERFKDELRLARRVSHRNVVRTHDLGESGDTTFITMELVEGTSLAALLRARGALPPAAVLSVAKQIARALAAAHEQGVLHGDLKPANLLVCASGVLKVTDFGVARLVRTSARSDATRGDAHRVSGAVLGTPAYMAPEVLLGQAPDVRADLYAAGMVLRECLTGETPYDDDTPMAFLARKLDAAAAETPPASRVVRAADGVADLGALVARLTAPDPAARPASAAALYDALVRLG